MTEKDITYMRRAIALAEQARGRTSPNPLVGCVLVKQGKVIAEGWHQVCGGDHAEVDALKKAGSRSRGAEMYVTLEPCFHQGRTPPCVDAVIASGVKAVIAGMADPNPLTNGKSFRKLRRAGIVVRTGVCEEDVRRMNAAFIKYITAGMPLVTAKIAETIDGRTAARSGDSKWITSEKTRAFARQRRSGFDAILVGINTVLADDSRLDAPGKAIRKVIVDSMLRIPERSRLLTGVQPAQVVVATTARAAASKVGRLRAKGVDVLVCPGKGARVNLKWLLKTLARRGISSVLIEGGAAVIGGAFKAGLVDRLHIYIAPKLLGDELARAAVVGLSIKKIAQAQALTFVAVERVGGDVFIEAEVCHVHRDR